MIVDAESTELRECLDVGEALGYGALVPEHEELERLVQCFWLARVIHALARARRSGYGEERVAKLVARAEKLHEELVGTGS